MEAFLLCRWAVVSESRGPRGFALIIDTVPVDTGHKLWPGLELDENVWEQQQNGWPVSRRAAETRLRNVEANATPQAAAAEAELK